MTAHQVEFPELGWTMIVYADGRVDFVRWAEDEEDDDPVGTDAQVG